MAMPEALFRVRGLNAYYGRSHVVQNASLDVGSECVGLMGRNGAGKTALARAIMGLTPPAAKGEVSLFGQPLLGLKPNEISYAGVGYVPQGRQLFPSLTVLETLKLTERRRGGEAGWTVDRVLELFPSLTKRLHASSANLSGGERSMLAIGRALMINPRFLILDEPTEGLAPAIVERVAESLRALVAEGIPVLLIEQSLRAVELASSRLYLMNVGVIALEIETAEFCGDKALQDRFLGILDR